MKKIHYCWFGNNLKSDLILKCIESWKKFCPEYEIIEWNESNFDINYCKYSKEAYNAKKWAFVSDVCRFVVLSQYGGIYLDTDVELLRTIDDLPATFVGFENQTYVASGLIRGAEPGDEICLKMLESYKADVFYNKDGSYNVMTVCERETNILKEYGLKTNGKLQTVAHTKVYPVEFFCPMNYITRKVHITSNTYSIHHYGASWNNDQKESFRGKVYKVAYILLGESVANRLRNIFKKK